MSTWTETVAEARRIPRRARVAQGFSRVRDFAEHIWRARSERAAARLTSVPHWLDRAAAGALPIPVGIPESLRRQIDARRREIEWLRTRRREARAVLARREARARIWWRGVVPITAYATRISLRVWYVAGHEHEPRPWQKRYYTRREAARAYLATRTRVVHRRYVLHRVDDARTPYILRHDVYGTVARWPSRPSRDEIRRAVTAQRAAWARTLWRQRAGRPDTAAPTTLGWRAWVWDDAERCLRSPHRGTPWIGPDLHVEHWDECEVLRGAAGIHARLMPRDWLRAAWTDSGISEGPSCIHGLVTGIVERYGRYVLGTTGWRAEHVVIRELCAPDVGIMLTLMQVYPEVKVHLSPYAECKGDRHAHR